MSNLSLEEFYKLSEKEKGVRYKELSDHDRFLVRISMPIKGEDVGFRELTEKEKKGAKEFEEAVKSGNIDKWFNEKEKNT